jgi:pimeloyl-ACP methyl ester carboxylesterase
VAARGGFVISTTSGGVPRLRYHLCAPEGCTRHAPLVFVHGMSSKPVEQFKALLPYAMRRGTALLVPEFRRPELRGYQRLAGRDGRLEAAVAFDAVLADAADYLGMPFGTFDLAGFSGGAQFAHRYALMGTGKVRRLVVAAAGWYTYLDSARAFPYGVRSRNGSEKRCDIRRFLELPVRVMVGEEDVKRSSNLRTTSRTDHEQGMHRLERALRWVDHLGGVARNQGMPSKVTLELLPQTTHSFREAMVRGQFGERLFRFLCDDPQDMVAPCSIGGNG